MLLLVPPFERISRFFKEPIEENHEPSHRFGAVFERDRPFVDSTEWQAGPATYHVPDTG
jgi:hypothetical protein